MYLPDGDMDLTLLGPVNEGILEVIARLLQNEINSGHQSRVTELEHINARVKIIKCLVDGVAVDLSVNQITGLKTFLYLEQEDRRLKNNHIFKKSILLVKGWCFYESRNLGSNYSLLSTYGLAIMVLYVIDAFDDCAHTPLAVLFKFLHFYGDLDWDKYGISLEGLVPVSELKRPQHGGSDFDVKYFNIIDPQKQSNNIGRSVNLGNSRRIRLAFSLGAKKLKDILFCPKDTDPEEDMNEFFPNLLERINEIDDPLIHDHLHGEVGRYQALLDRFSPPPAHPPTPFTI